MGHIQLGAYSTFREDKKTPPAYQQEVEDFIDFILSKKRPPIAKKGAQRSVGLLKCKLQMADDFNDPLGDFKDYM